MLRTVTCLNVHAFSMTSDKTLLLVAPYFPPHTGGLERYAYEMGKRCVGNGWRVVVVTTSETKQNKTEVRDGMIIHRLSYTMKLSNTPFGFLWPVRIWRILREVSLDMVHIHTPVPGLGDLVACMMGTSVPLVVTYHSGSMRKGNLFADVLVWVYEHTMMRLLLWRAHRIVCSSDFVRHSFLGRYVHKSETIPPGVDTDTFVPVASTPRVPTILFVGGLGVGEAHKGLARILHMVARIREQVPQVRLHVVGDGAERKRYETLAHTLGVADAVQFLGAYDTKGMVHAYQTASVFALPSTNDSFPTVILEAMSCGVPVVAYDVGSVRDMVRHETDGYVVLLQDEELFVAYLTRILTKQDIAQKMRSAVRTHSLEFEWHTRTEAYERVYEALLTPKPTIAHVTAYYPPHMGGMEVVAQALAEGMARKGYSVRVLTSDAEMGHGVSRIEQHDNILIHRLRSITFAHTPIIFSLPFRLMFLPRGTVVHVHAAQAFVPELALLIARVRGFACVVQVHLDIEASGTFGFLLPWYKRFFFARVLRGADAVLVFSNEQAHALCAQYGVSSERIHVVRNGVHSMYHGVVRDAMHTPLRILFVGRLTIQKRVDRLIDAVGMCKVPVVLTIVGDGELRSALETRAETHAHERVRFVGSKTPDEVCAYYREADVFVLPSDKEGMPLTLLEAMMSGLPAIGSNVTGIREHLAGVGVLVHTTPKACARAIETIAGDANEYRRLSEKSSAYARACSWENVIGSVCEIYHARKRE